MRSRPASSRSAALANSLSKTDTLGSWSPSRAMAPAPQARPRLLGAAELSAGTGLGRSPRPDLSNDSGSRSPWPRSLHSSCSSAAPPRSQLSHPAPGQTHLPGASSFLTPSCSSSSTPTSRGPLAPPFLLASPLPAQAGLEKYIQKPPGPQPLNSEAAW